MFVSLKAEDDNVAPNFKKVRHWDALCLTFCPNSRKFKLFVFLNHFHMFWFFNLITMAKIQQSKSNANASSVWLNTKIFYAARTRDTANFMQNDLQFSIIKHSLPSHFSEKRPIQAFQFSGKCKSHINVSYSQEA